MVSIRCCPLVSEGTLQPALSHSALSLQATAQFFGHGQCKSAVRTLNLSPSAWINSSSGAGHRGVVYKMPSHLSHEIQCRNMGCINKGKKDSSFYMQGQTVFIDTTLLLNIAS